MWDVEVQVQKHVVQRLENVDVPPSGPSLDARLDRIDLREFVDCVRVRFVSGQGAPQAAAKFLVANVLVASDAEGWTRVAVPRGVRVVTKDSSGAEVEVVDGASIRIVD
jgi:arginine/ornithine N-succinyltransferase beta subunit